MGTLADFRPAYVSFFGGNLVIMGTLPFFEPLKWAHFFVCRQSSFCGTGSELAG